MRFARSIYIILGVALLVFVVIGYRYYGLKRIMAPYTELVNTNATREKVVALLGQPYFVINNEKDLETWTRNYQPKEPIMLYDKGEILVYFIDPFPSNKGEGYVVYICLDRENKTYQATLGN